MTPRRTAAVAAALLALLALTSCSSGGDADPMGSGGGDAGFADAEELDATSQRDGADAALVQARDLPRPVGEEKRVTTASVSLAADDVAALRFDVQKIVDASGAEVAEEQTSTGDDGEVLTSRLVLRVPSADVEETLSSLERTGTLLSSERSSDVVTEAYVDLQARVRAQERGLRRVEVLFARAQSIRDIMAIEGEVTRRQADLDSLKGQLQVLEDQTSRATVTVHLEQTSVADPAERRDGFVGGLVSGWEALTQSVGVLSTVLGAVLPFALVGLLLAVPVRLLLRRAARRRDGARPVAADA